jgi:hypothetical protein
MMRRKLSSVDLLGLVHRAFSEPRLGEELCNDPRSVLGQHGIRVPGDLATFSVRRFHPFDEQVLGDCELFDVCPDTSARQGHPFELRLFWYGAKDVVFLLGQTGTLRIFGASAISEGYCAMLTPYQWIPEGESAKGGYSNRMTYAPLTDRRAATRRGLVIARSENDAALAWVSSILGWDSVFGRVLGYPDCCVDSFCKCWPYAQAQHHGDLVPITITASGPGPFDWQINTLGRYFGLCPIQHFPCTFTCKASIELAEKTLCCLRKCEPDVLPRLEELMRAPALYTANSGVFVFPGGEVAVCNGEWGMHYDPKRIISSTRQSAMFHLLCQRDMIVGLAGDTLRIDSESESYLMVFQ